MPLPPRAIGQNPAILTHYANQSRSKVHEQFEDSTSVKTASVLIFVGLCTVFFRCCTVLCKSCIGFWIAVTFLLAALLEVQQLYRIMCASVSSNLSAPSLYLLIHHKESEPRLRQAQSEQKQSTARTLQKTKQLTLRRNMYTQKTWCAQKGGPYKSRRSAAAQIRHLQGTSDPSSL